MIQSARPDPGPAAPPDPGDRPALAAWHAGWAVAAALLALGGRWIGGVDGPVFYGVLAMVIPGLTGLGLLRRDGAGERMMLLGVWGLAAFLSAALSGGLTGPLTGFVFLPLAAGIALGGPRPVQAGALAVGLAAVAGLLSAWWGGPGPHLPALAAISALLTAGAAALAVRLSWRQRERRLETAEADAARIETLLAAQPGLMLILEPSGRDGPGRRRLWRAARLSAGGSAVRERPGRGGARARSPPPARGHGTGHGRAGGRGRVRASSGP
ncbi:hypothetical protein [Brevundimonas sp. Root1423]|uniref:hypothetical protein n=1 Tax=Brevundimonas sp. Root1423 TaxID=1736462 RepID=UPI0007017BE4|nr:hypothetical protein [Brevundimonas sp. Root1423]KQY85217.1 hypothetical protein ASD25_23645 [Brevundimonas sp. Root1423]